MEDTESEATVESKVSLKKYQMHFDTFIVTILD